MKRNILTYSLLVLASAFAACSDKEYTVNTGEGSTTPSQPPAPLVREVESFTVPGTEVSFDMVLVHGGTFTMGGYDAEGPEHQVTLSHDYYIGRTEVTQALYRAVMQANPSEFTYGDDYPVDQVSHWDAVHFCQKLSQLTGYRFTLPTEAQWEYAAQGGATAHLQPAPTMRAATIWAMWVGIGRTRRTTASTPPVGRQGATRRSSSGTPPLSAASRPTPWASAT